MNVTMALASSFRLLHAPPQLAKSPLFGGVGFLVRPPQLATSLLLGGVAFLLCVNIVYTLFPGPFSNGAQHLALRSFDVHPAQT